MTAVGAQGRKDIATAVRDNDAMGSDTMVAVRDNDAMGSDTIRPTPRPTDSRS